MPSLEILLKNPATGSPDKYLGLLVGLLLLALCRILVPTFVSPYEYSFPQLDCELVNLDVRLLSCFDHVGLYRLGISDC